MMITQQNRREGTREVEKDVEKGRECVPAVHL